MSGLGGVAEALELFLLVWRLMESFGEGAGVEFDAGRAGEFGGFDMLGVRVDEKADDASGILEGLDNGLEAFDLSGDIKTALGGDFLPVFGDQADEGGANFEGEGEHAPSGGHFEVEGNLEELAQAADVITLDVAGIFARVDGYAVGTGDDSELGKGDGIGFDDAAGGLVVIAVTRLPEGGAMIDIDAKEEVWEGVLGNLREMVVGGHD